MTVSAQKRCKIRLLKHPLRRRDAKKKGEGGFGPAGVHVIACGHGEASCACGTHPDGMGHPSGRNLVRPFWGFGTALFFYLGLRVAPP